jgi:hypothetical protein
MVSGLEKLRDWMLDRWQHDATFGEQVRQDPEAIVRQTGIDMTDADWAVVRSIDWTLTDEQLQERLRSTFLSPR